MAADVAAGVSCSGVGERGMTGPNTSLAWLAGGSDGLLVGEGIAAGVVGAGEGAAGQRPQVAAQYPLAGAPAANMMADSH